MVYVVLKYRVEDYSRWKPVFDNYGSMRVKSGCKGGKLFHSSGNPNEIFILFEWDIKENAAKFFESEDTKKTQKGAGVISKPEIQYIDKIEDFSA